MKAQEHPLCILWTFVYSCHPQTFIPGQLIFVLRIPGEIRQVQKTVVWRTYSVNR